MSAQDYSIIEGAYFAGFEPSSGSMPAEELYSGALAYLTDLSTH